MKMFSQIVVDSILVFFIMFAFSFGLGHFYSIERTVDKAAQPPLVLSQ